MFVVVVVVCGSGVVWFVCMCVVVRMVVCGGIYK